MEEWFWMIHGFVMVVPRASSHRIHRPKPLSSHFCFPPQACMLAHIHVNTCGSMMQIDLPILIYGDRFFIL